MKKASVEPNVKVSRDRPVLVKGDMTNLISVFQNIIGNSCDAFTTSKVPRDQRYIQIEFREQENNLIEIYIADNAGGILALRSRPTPLPTIGCPKGIAGGCVLCRLGSTLRKVVFSHRNLTS